MTQKKSRHGINLATLVHGLKEEKLDDKSFCGVWVFTESSVCDGAYPNWKVSARMLGLSFELWCGLAYLGGTIDLPFMDIKDLFVRNYVLATSAALHPWG